MTTAENNELDLSRQRDLKDRIAAILNNYLSEQDMSQSALARRAQIPRDNISRYCRGVSLPSAGHAQRLAKVINVDLESLMGLAPELTLTDVNVKLMPNGFYQLSLKKEFRAADLAKVLAVVEEIDQKHKGEGE